MAPRGSSHKAFNPTPNRNSEMARKIPVTMPIIPSLNLTALPRASILHSKAMTQGDNLNIKTPVFYLDRSNIVQTAYCEDEIEFL